MSDRTTVAVDKGTLAELRQTQRELSASQRRKIATDDLLRMALRALRQIAAAGQATQ